MADAVRGARFWAAAGRPEASDPCQARRPAPGRAGARCAARRPPASSSSTCIGPACRTSSSIHRTRLARLIRPEMRALLVILQGSAPAVARPCGTDVPPWRRWSSSRSRASPWPTSTAPIRPGRRRTSSRSWTRTARAGARFASGSAPSARCISPRADRATAADGSPQAGGNGAGLPERHRGGAARRATRGAGALQRRNEVPRTPEHAATLFEMRDQLALAKTPSAPPRNSASICGSKWSGYVSI